MAVQRTGLTAAALTVAVLLVHGVAIDWLAAQWRPPTSPPPLAKPLYTRQITPQPAPAPPSAPHEPVALAASSRPAITSIANATSTDSSVQRAARKRAVAKAARDDSAAPSEPPARPSAFPGGADQPAASGETADARPPAAAGAAAASEAAAALERPDSEPPAPWSDWPTDTRLRYELTGYYLGELHGSAQVLWQREADDYEAVVEIDLGLLAYLKLTSRGRITAHGLAPRFYEELQRTRRRGVRLEDEAVVLDSGKRLSRPPQVQDTASQFVELAHRFATGRVPLAAGQTIALWLARPGGVDRWTYDVAGKVTLPTPALGPVEAYHLQPQSLVRPSGSYSAEIWFAPSLQHLPVRIRVTMGDSAWVDLVVKRIDQR